MNNIIKRSWNQGSMTHIEDLQGSAFTSEDGGHTFQISGIDSNGNHLALTGSVAAIFLRPDQTSVALSGAANSGVVSVTLTDECYGVPGRFGLVIFLTSDGNKTAIYSCVGNVARSSTDAVAPGVTADVVDLINQIEAVVATIPAGYYELWKTFAPIFNTQTSYVAGEYVTYNGHMYRFTAAHPAGSFTTADCVQVNIAGELNDAPLKSEIDLIVERAFIRAEIEAAAEAVENVSMCRAFVNLSNKTDEYGIAPNTVMIAFSGGNATAVATAVKPHIPAGMQTAGNLTIDLEDGTIYLERPTNTYVAATVTVVPGTGYDSTVADTIKQTVSDYTYALYIGEGLYATDLITKIKLVAGGVCDVTQIVFTYNGQNQTYGFNGDPTKRWLLRVAQIQIAEA